MSSFFSKPIVVYFIATIILSAIFFLIPINIFDGVYTFKVNGITFAAEAKMSLSYFIGIGSAASDLQDVVSFKLVPMGYLLVFLFLVALPILIAYRVHIANNQRENKQ